VEGRRRGRKGWEEVTAGTSEEEEEDDERENGFRRAQRFRSSA